MLSGPVVSWDAASVLTATWETLSGKRTRKTSLNDWPTESHLISFCVKWANFQIICYIAAECWNSVANFSFCRDIATQTLHPSSINPKAARWVLNTGLFIPFLKSYYIYNSLKVEPMRIKNVKVPTLSRFSGKKKTIFVSLNSSSIQIKNTETLEAFGKIFQKRRYWSGNLFILLFLKMLLVSREKDNNKQSP